jgi:murein DD-endopeptidase
MKLDYRRPCNTRVIRDDFADHIKRHSNLPGVDYACKTGDSVYATADGMILSVSHLDNSASGINIVIRHPDGQKSYYLHLSRILVGVGRRVKAGKLIARSGNTGRSTGPHLHFSIRNKAGKCVDPEKVIDGPRKPKGPAVKSAKTVELPPAPVDAAE